MSTKTEPQIVDAHCPHCDWDGGAPENELDCPRCGEWMTDNGPYKGLGALFEEIDEVDRV